MSEDESGNDMSFIEYTTNGLTQISKIAKEVAQQKSTNMRTMTPQQYRENQQTLAEVRPLPPGLDFTKGTILGVPCEWVTHLLGEKEERVIVYLHGGSWMFGSLDSARPVAAMIAKRSRFRVLIVDYRKAPEDPFPAGFEDCYKVYCHLLDSGLDSSKISLFGDSAGGNYCLALINRLKAEEKPLPASVGLASPVTDMRDSSSLISSGDDLLYTINNGEEESIFKVYLGERYLDQRYLPILSPITADLSGLPPMLIHTGGDEALKDDNIKFARKVSRFGGEIGVKVWREMFHDFTVVGVSLRESRQSMEELAEFFKDNMREEKTATLMLSEKSSKNNRGGIPNDALL